MFVFDCETWLIKPGLLAPPLVCVSYAFGEAPHVDQTVRLALKDDGTDAVERALDNGEVLVGHNVAFDFAVVATHRPRLLKKIFKAYKEGRVRDTKVRQQLIDNEHGCLFHRRFDGTVGYALADLEKHYLQRDRSAQKLDENGWRMRFQELDGVPLQLWPAEAIQYALEDAEGTRAVYNRQRPNHWPYEEPLVNEVERVYAAWSLHLCSVTGINTNEVPVNELEARCEFEFLRIQEEMVSKGLVKIRKATKKEITEGKIDFSGTIDGVEQHFRYSRNMAAIRARVEVAYRATSRAVPRTDPTETAPMGNVRTDADTLEYSGDKVLEELGGAGPISTIRKTFIPVLKRGTHTPINARFNVLVETGRPSCSGPNLYNIPRDGGVRECFEARPGFLFCSVDYDCAELRSLAQVCLWLFGKSELAEFFQKDPKGDPHLEMAAFMLGIDPEQAKAWRRLPCVAPDPKVGDPDLCKHCFIKDMRQMCKAFNFGLPGGMGTDSMVSYARKSYGVVISKEKAVEGKSKWLNRWPEMRLYFDYVSRLVGLGGATIMQMKPGGGPHRKRGNVGFCDGCNTFFQGLTADAFMAAICALSEEMYVDESSPLFGSRLLVPLYDEGFGEVPEGPRQTPAALRWAEVMRVAAQQWLPDVPVTCEAALMKRWTKKAEPVWVGEELVAWDLHQKRAA